MYQVNKSVHEMYKEIGENSETIFEEIVGGFYLTMANPELMTSFAEAWDLKKKYCVNHACIWNKLENIGKDVQIVFKNNKIALVSFDGKLPHPDRLLEHIYRLEDISEIIVIVTTETK